MSRTPVLTKKQQKTSLSAKKTKTRETVRNALASPYSKYWPLVSNEHYQILKNVLNQYLPKLLPDRVEIPWTELRKVPKSERKQFRDQYTLEHFGPDYLKRTIDKRDGLILGINDITKSLEREEAKSVLITEDILPRLMVEHVIDQAILLRIPVLVVPELRTILKENCGIAGGAVAFTDWPKYKLVQDKIRDISKKYPIPENHINFNRAQNVADDSVIIIEDSIIEDISQTIPCICVDNPTQEIGKKSNKHCTVEDIEPVENVHLIRTDKSKRVFIPQKSSEELHRDKMDVDTSDFLSFSANPSYEQNIKKKYVSLKVLRTKGDNNRTKKKIQAIKHMKTKLGKSKKN